jgi:hypothetical protein
MDIFTILFGEVLKDKTFNKQLYFEALYYLIYYRYKCDLSNSKNIEKLEFDFLDTMNINKNDLLYKPIKKLLHYEIRTALPIKDTNSYNEEELIDALNRCIKRYKSYDSKLLYYMSFNREFATKLIY